MVPNLVWAIDSWKYLRKRMDSSSRKNVHTGHTWNFAFNVNNFTDLKNSSVRIHAILSLQWLVEDKTDSIHFIGCKKLGPRAYIVGLQSSQWQKSDQAGDFAAVVWPIWKCRCQPCEQEAEETKLFRISQFSSDFVNRLQTWGLCTSPPPPALVPRVWS